MDYNFVTRHFELTCFGRNGVTVNGIFHPQSTPPIMLQNKYVGAGLTGSDGCFRYCVYRIF